MIAGEKLRHSVCFSAEPIQDLNDKTFQLDHRLYLFAYYSPTPYQEGESEYSCFRTAVVNLYGLLWDCSPFMATLLNSPCSILWRNWDSVKDNFHRLQSTLSAFRTIFCHNCCRELTMNEEHYRVAEEYIFHVLKLDLSVDSLEDPQWAALLIKLQDMAQTFIFDISDALSLIICSSDEHKRNRSITLWIEAIARSYQRNPEYLLHTMSALYQWYLDNNGEPASGNPNAPLRKQTLNWLSDYFGASGKDWYHRWLPKIDDELQNSSLYQILMDWPHQWAIWNSLHESDCWEPPLPGSIFFRILASDVDRFAASPSIEFDLYT